MKTTTNTNTLNQATIIALLNEVNTKLDSKKTVDVKAEQDKAILAKIDPAYKGTVLVLTTIAAVSPFFCIPLAIIASIALAVVTGLHYYDKKHDNKLSYWTVNTAEKIWRWLNGYSTSVTANAKVETLVPAEIEKLVPEIAKALKLEANDNVVTMKHRTKHHAKISSHHAAMFNQKRHSSRELSVKFNDEMQPSVNYVR